MAGFIRDNGLVSPLNRGTFYGARDAAGRLEGVALVGHVTQLEARSDGAVRAFARAAQGCRTAHVIMGECETVGAFWRHYAGGGQAARLACRELLMEQGWPAGACEAVPELRRAVIEELPLVMPVQARMAAEECGVDPRDVDPVGFYERGARRVGRGRIWVVVRAGRLAFKADVMAETPECAYVEGVYVAPELRGAGYGLRCLAQLGRVLLSRARSVCLLANERSSEACSFYRRAGYRRRAVYDTIYLHRPAV
jgi:hypothetical protein